MELKELVKRINQFLLDKEQKKLSDIEEIIVKAIWEDKKYQEVQNYSKTYVKNEAYKLWKRFSNILDKKITRKNFKREITNYLLSENTQVEAVPQEQDEKPVKMKKYDEYWVGREAEIQDIIQKIKEPKIYIYMILGLTGIGKTALSKKVLLELKEWFDIDDNWNQNFARVNFDYEDKAQDFIYHAKEWLRKWNIPITQENDNPDKILKMIVNHLCENKKLIFIDSLENILTGNQDDGWGGFKDEMWKRFFENIFVADNGCKSRILITSQDLPTDLTGARDNDSHMNEIILKGLKESEQKSLCQKYGFDIPEGSDNLQILLRIGKIYFGHPLVLKVIFGEINTYYNGNIQAFWNDERNKVKYRIEEVEAESNENKRLGKEGKWRLHKLTAKMRRSEVYTRIQTTVNKLEVDSPDAYYMLCAASYYRCPVKASGWYTQFNILLKILDIEKKDNDEDREIEALDILERRSLVQFQFKNGESRLGLHNLIRSFAKERLDKMRDDKLGKEE